MNAMTTYLFFDGECKEAMQFYKECLGGELFLMTYGEAPCETPDNLKDRIIHASLKNGSAVLMASDKGLDIPLNVGNNFKVSIGCDSMEELQKFFAALSEKGTVRMPLADTFWGAHLGMLTDKFGINWMVSLPTPA